MVKEIGGHFPLGRVRVVVAQCHRRGAVGVDEGSALIEGGVAHNLVVAGHGQRRYLVLPKALIA